MVDEITAFDTDSLLESSIGNLQGIILAIVAYYKEKGIDTKEFTFFVGEKFAPGWEVAKEWSIDEVARRLALNYASMGAVDVKITGEFDAREIHFKDWPNQSYLDGFKIKRSEVNDIFFLFTDVNRGYT